MGMATLIEVGDDAEMTLPEGKILSGRDQPD